LVSRAWALASAGLENILALSGDYPAAGYRGEGRPVFDLDSVSLLQMLRQMNQGWTAPVAGKAFGWLARPTRFFMGAVVSPYKRLESELIPQYLKLERKIGSGAEFIITQTGFDSRKLDDLIRYLAHRHLEVPLIANVYLLSAPVTRYFHQGGVPGIVVTDRLLALAEKQSAAPDQGKAFFRELAARQIAIARGLGCRGAYLAGSAKAEEILQIFARADALKDCWRDFVHEVQFGQEGEFYYFGPDAATALSSSTPQLPRRAAGPLRHFAAPGFRFSRRVHRLLFERGSLGYRLGRALYARVDRSPATARALHVLEQAIKIPLYGCRDCGDCSLAEIAYLCAESQCAKRQRNGPCGGSRDGRCESAGRECIWSRAYRRLKAVGLEHQLLQRPVVVTDARLRGSSAWANRFLERDHRAAQPKEPVAMG
jgi:methylenetetrahydrofolate reductase (NADPH)